MNALPLTYQHILIFDWGNTVMKVLPGHSGPMAFWPQVAAEDGIEKALDSLKGQCKIALATNASDSDAELVWQALKRVGLDPYFSVVFTSRELGCRKPDQAFFRQLESVFARHAYQMIMVGDDYNADILGAKQAGWHTVWYNPRRLAAPGLMPLHDEEITSLQALPAVLYRASLPDHAQVLAWLLQRNTPYNLLAHLQLVAAVAYQLAIWLRARDVALDPVLVHRGAMLHDLAKMDSVRLRQERGIHGDHARMAYELLIDYGQPELAEIADRHMPVSDPASRRAPLTWEQKIVHFADKMAEGAQLVSPETRFQALSNRYPDFRSELQAAQPYLLTLQEEFCARLEMTPQEMFNELQKAIGG